MELDDNEINTNSIQTKKHKHSKHKKHKRKQRIREDSEGSIDMSVEEEIKVTKSPLLQQSPISVDQRSGKMNNSKSNTPTPITNSNVSSKTNITKKKRTRGRDSGTSSEEERWLDAIESGKLEDVDDELKKIKPKDPKLMTARQRAMYERGTDKESSPGGEMLMSLPTGYKEKVMTAEAIQKAALKSQKRKQLADEKREKDKKRTMERLLKKQESKTKTNKLKIKRHAPLISYKQNINETTLSYADGALYTIQKKCIDKLPEKILCGIPGCNNLKKYSCSKTNIPLCSFECYKLNYQNLNIQITT